MREVASNLDLARRQQRITLKLLAERCNLSVPTVQKLLSTGEGSVDSFFRVANVLCLLKGIEDATNPLNTPLGKIRAEEDVPKRVRI